MKITSLRSAVAAVAMLGAVSFGPAGHAADTTLNIIRDDHGGVIQAIPVQSWSYDRGKQLISITTVDGDRQCPGAPESGSWSGPYMKLDGEYYRLEKLSVPNRDRGTITVFPVRDGVFPLCSGSGSSYVAEQRYEAKALGDLKIELDVISGSRLTERAFAVSGVEPLGGVPPIPPDDYVISYDTGAGVVRAGDAISPSTLSEEWPPLCLQTSTGGTQLQFDDTNGQGVTLEGVSLKEYRLGDTTLALETGSGLTCFAVPSTQEVPLDKDEASACGQGSGIFGSGFENDANVAIEQLSLKVVVNTFPSLDGASLDYDLIVENCSEQELSGIWVRDFYSSTNASVAGEYLLLNIPSLAPRGLSGSRHVENVVRTVNGGSGDEVVVTTVAMRPDGSDVPQHQIKSWTMPVVTTNNDAPTLTVTDGALPTAAAPFELDEDDAGVPVTGFTLTATDEDTGFDCAGGSCVVVNSTDPSVISSGGVSADFNAGVVTLALSPQANAFGDVTLSIAVADAGGAVSNSVNIPVRVNAVNDPPTFEIGKGFDRTTAAKAYTVTGSTYCTLAQTSVNGAFELAQPGCPDQHWEANPTFPNDELVYDGWIVNVSGGPNESETAQLSVTIPSDPQDIINGWQYDAGTNRLNYRLTGAKGSAILRITADDGTAQTSVDVVVDVDNAQPVINGGDTASFAYDENDTAVIATISATDADDPGAVTYAIGGGADAALFDLDAVSGDLTFLAAPDFEAPADSDGNNAYEVTVVASDGAGGSDSQAVTVNVQNVNEPPVIEAGQVFSVDENASQGTVVGIVSASDPEGDTITGWEIIAGNDDVNNNSFKPFARNGAQIEVLDSGDLDFETTPQFILTVRATDGVNPAVTEDITINLNDLVE